MKWYFQKTYTDGPQNIYRRQKVKKTFSDVTDTENHSKIRIEIEVKKLQSEIHNKLGEAGNKK